MERVHNALRGTASRQKQNGSQDVPMSRPCFLTSKANCTGIRRLLIYHAGKVVSMEKWNIKKLKVFAFKSFYEALKTAVANI
jgi:hypothetical protein